MSVVDVVAPSLPLDEVFTIDPQLDSSSRIAESLDGTGLDDDQTTVADAEIGSQKRSLMQHGSRQWRRFRICFLSTFLDQISVLYILVVVCATTAFLTTHRGNCGFLRLWLWINCALTVTRGLCRMARTSVKREIGRKSDAVIYMHWFVKSAATGWHITGLVFLVLAHKRTCESAVFAFAMTLVVIELVVWVVSVLLGIAILLFAPTSSRELGCSSEAIEKLHSFSYDAHNVSAPTDKCCLICKSEYMQGEKLRELPCRTGAHIYHASCVDVWLELYAWCPLCFEDPTAALRGRRLSGGCRDGLAGAKTISGVVSGVYDADQNVHATADELQTVTTNYDYVNAERASTDSIVRTIQAR